jgi:hypothetical protein
MAIAPTVRLGSFDSLPVAGTRRGDRERDGRAFAKELAHLAAGQPSNSMLREPRWTTPNRVALELPSMRLREFSADGDDAARWRYG